MKSNKFVKEFGWDEAKKILTARRTWIDKKSGRELTDNSFVMQTRTYEYAIGTLYRGTFTDYDKNSYRCGEVNLLMLENLVESHELVESYGGINELRREKILAWELNMPRTYELLRKAIKDVESCM